MTIYGISVDSSRGFDVTWGKKSSAHFSTYEEARACADSHRAAVIRYFAASENSGEEGKA